MHHRVYILILVSTMMSLVLNSSMTLADQDQSLGIEGLRCDSCGMECSTVCGSRAFRTCCFNYIKKKRSGTDDERPGGNSKAKLMRRVGGGGVGPLGLWVSGDYFEPQIQAEGPWAWLYPAQAHFLPSGGDEGNAEQQHGRSRTSLGVGATLV